MTLGYGWRCLVRVGDGLTCESVGPLGGAEAPVLMAVGVCRLPGDGDLGAGVVESGLTPVSDAVSGVGGNA